MKNFTKRFLLLLFISAALGIANQTRSQSAAADVDLSGVITEACSYIPGNTDAPMATLFNNGPVFNSAGTGAGGANESIYYQGGTGTYGSGCQWASGIHVADDFTVPSCKTWAITSMDFYSYQTNSTTTPTITGIYVRIWNGKPGVAGSTIIWGDMTTNRLSATSFANVYRVLVPNGGVARPIMKVVANTPGLSLSTASYWVEWACTGSLAAGPWVPPVVTASNVTGNAIQTTDNGVTYYDVLYNTFAQGFPFVINGTETEPSCSYITNPPLNWLSCCELARYDTTTFTIWSGSVNNDWFNAGNWIFGVPGGAKPDAWIPSGLANYPTISNPGAFCRDIYIRDGASILGNNNLTIAGNAYVERLVNHLGLTNYWQHCNWLDDSLAITYPADIHYLSSPVPDAKDSTVEQDAVWRWQEPNQHWFWLHHSCSEPCKGPPWIWQPGIGYSVAPNEYWWCQTTDCPDYNIPPGLCAAPWKCQYYREFIDDGLNYGSIDVPLTHTVQLPGMLYPPGWNLLGNPYPSAIDWFAVPTVNVYTNSACMWCDTIGGYKYVVGQNGFIPIIQGFMVQCAPGGGSVTFIEAARLHNNNAPLWKSGNTSFLTLQVSNSVNSYKDATYIGFNSEAQDGFDLLDGTKLGNLSNAPMIYSVLPDNTSLAVNSLNSSQTAYQVPVHFKAGVAGNHTINVTGIESINDNTPLYLEDRKLDISQDIRGNPVYTFSANPSDDRDRFILHFAPLGIKDFSLSNVAIYSYDKNVCINVPAEVIGTASVINLLGMEILSQKLIPGKLNKISVTGLTGYYVVRVVSSGNVFTQKVFIN